MEQLTQKLNAALNYFSQNYDANSTKLEDVSTGEICNSIKGALELVQAAKMLPELSKERAMHLITVKTVADDCEELKIQETGNGFVVGEKAL